MVVFYFNNIWNDWIKINEIVNKFLLTGDKFMPELHLRQLGFTYSTCGLFTKHLERIRKLKEASDLKYIYKNELDKVCFAHDAAYFGSKDLTKRTVSDKILKYRASENAINPKYDGNQRGLASMVYNFFDKIYRIRNESKCKWSPGSRTTQTSD